MEPVDVPHFSKPFECLAFYFDPRMKVGIGVLEAEFIRRTEMSDDHS